MSVAREIVERVFREEGGAVLATLIRQLRDFDLAEVVVQDAFAIALEHWAEDSVPDRPGAWILTTARRRALDVLRHRRVTERKRDAVVGLAEAERELAEAAADPMPDDGLRLIFTCCHPALSTEARVALTLRTVGGLTTPEIARAFLVPETTMAQRLLRAKAKIKRAGIPHRVPEPDELPERLEGVLAVQYLVFNEGYFPGEGGDAVRTDLCEAALRSTGLLAGMLPEPEVLGLLALMTLQHARRGARVDADGAMAPLETQDRSRWDRAATARGIALVERALAMKRPGPYQLQAAISALHAEASTAEDTDWPQIVLLYRELASRTPGSVVELNLAIALSHLRGPADALERVDSLDGLDRYQPFHAARADLLRRLERVDEARDAYSRAMSLTENAVVRRFLSARVASLEVRAKPGK